MQVSDSGRVNISWSASVEYLRNFTIFYSSAQNYFQQARANHALLVQLFDSIHEVYRMELPYLNYICNKSGISEFDRISKMHNDLEKKIANYINGTENFKRNNFGNYYAECDRFFTELTRIAVTKSFFPKAHVEKTVEEMAEHLKQR